MKYKNLLALKLQQVLESWLVRLIELFLFQKYIANAKLQSKFTPKINFYIDNTFDEAEKITKLLLNQKVSRDLESE